MSYTIGTDLHIYNDGIPYGYCHCGCGRKTNIAPCSRKRDGHLKGEPMEFIKGHFKQQSIEDRFWSKVDKSRGNDACWNWTAKSGDSGYGSILVGGRGGLFPFAHRLAYQLTHGTIPDGLWVLHKCDNPSCCNPSHLFLGTHQENMRDRNTKGRQAHLKGESAGNHKLNTETVKYIRSRYDAGGISQLELAHEIGISLSAISQIVLGKTWKNV